MKLKRFEDGSNIVVPEFNKREQFYMKVQRVLSFLVALAGIIVLLPVFLVLGIWIVISDGFPIFFLQKRVKNEVFLKEKNKVEIKYFSMMKFRSMYKSTPHNTPTHLLKNPEQYITEAGKFLRKTSLDELPQLLNVLKGDMNLIGPRPALYNQEDLLAERDKYGANFIRPGITGWAQVHGRDELEIEEKARLDGYYVQNLGLMTDLKCLLLTVKAVLKKDGVVEGGTGAVEK